MSRPTFQSNFVSIGELESNNTVIVQNNSLLAWDSRKKHKDIKLINSSSSTNLPIILSGYKAVISTRNIVVGANEFSWSLVINNACTMRAGVALSTRDLYSSELKKDVVFKQFNVNKNDRVIFLMKLNKLIIKFYDRDYSLSLTHFTGQTMYPWVSSVPGSGLYVTITNYKNVDMSINEERALISSPELLINSGNVSVGGTELANSEIVTKAGEHYSISTGNQDEKIVILDDSVLIESKINTDTIEIFSSQLVINGGGTESIIVDDDGITVEGDIISQNIIASKITADGKGINVSPSGDVSFDNISFNIIQSETGNDLLLSESLGLGITISDITGKFNASEIITNVVDSNSVNQYTSPTKIEIANAGIGTEIKGGLGVNENMNIVGNITCGTINGFTPGSTSSYSTSVFSDVNINAVSNNNILQYNHDTEKWINRDLSSAGFSSNNHNHTSSDVTDINTSATTYINAQKGIPLGIVGLDVNGKSTSELAGSANGMEYQGTWNASTNTPNLSSGAGTQGHYYVISVSGSTTIDSITDWRVSDWIIYNGTVWERVNNANFVTSVNGYGEDVTLSATDLSDISSAGSGEIITAQERTIMASTNAANLGSVMSHSDVLDAGSGAIITDVERNSLGVNTLDVGSVTVHSDIQIGAAESGKIITSAERDIINNFDSTPYINMHSEDITHTMSGNINMGSNIIKGCRKTYSNNMTCNSIDNNEQVFVSGSIIAPNITVTTPINSRTSSHYSLISSGSEPHSYTIGNNNNKINFLTSNIIALIGDDNVINVDEEGISFTIGAQDKSEGTGVGGDLILRGGTSFGGHNGKIIIPSIVCNKYIEVEPAGEAGAVYYNDIDNHLYVHNGTEWIELK